MSTSESAVDEINKLSYLINNAVSMELRVENSKVADTIKIMEELGFIRKNLWASMQLTDHTVIDFWKKELIKT